MSSPAAPTLHRAKPPDPLEPSNEAARFHNQVSPAGSESIASLWRVKTQSLWQSISGRNGQQSHHHALSTGNSAWEWLSVRHARMAARLTGCPRPASAAAPSRRHRRSGILEASTNCINPSLPLAQHLKSSLLDLLTFSAKALPHFKEHTRRRSLGDLLNAFALRLNFERPASTEPGPSPMGSEVDPAGEVLPIEELLPPVIDMPRGLKTCLERSNSLRQGVEQTFRDWSDNKKDFGQKAHKIPLMPQSAAEFRRTVEQRRTLRENKGPARGLRGPPERIAPLRQDSRAPRHSRPPRPPFAAPGSTGMKPEDVTGPAKARKQSDVTMQKMLCPIPPKRCLASASVASPTDLDDVYKDCVSSLEDIYRQVLTEVGVPKSADASSQSMGDFGPVFPRNTHATKPTVPPRTLSARFLNERLDNTNLAIYLKAQSQSADDVSGKHSDFIPESWINMAFEGAGFVPDCLKPGFSRNAKDAGMSAPRPGTPASPMSIQSAPAKVEVQTHQATSKTVPPLATSLVSESSHKSLETETTETDGGRRDSNETARVDTGAAIISKRDSIETGHSGDNAPSSPSEYSQASGKRLWSEDSSQDSPVTDASSVKRLSTARATNLGKIKEDETSSRRSSEDRFFEMEVIPDEQTVIGMVDTGTMTALKQSKVTVAVGEK